MFIGEAVILSLIRNNAFRQYLTKAGLMKSQTSGCRSCDLTKSDRYYVPAVQSLIHNALVNDVKDLKQYLKSVTGTNKVSARINNELREFTL